MKHRIFFIDDDPHFLNNLRRNLQFRENEWIMEFLTSPVKALNMLEGENELVLVSDWQMAEIDGLSVIKYVREANAAKEAGYCYIILLTGKQNIEAIVEALECVADDFITKPFDVRELEARIRVGFRIIELHRELRLVNEQLTIQATIDPLTKAFNRRRGKEILASELDRVLRKKQDLSILMIDLDKFKDINDTYGHEAGDIVLCEAIQRFSRESRMYDCVVRWGGDEIVIICPHTSRDKIVTIAERLRMAIVSKPVQIDKNVRLTISASIGTATACIGTEICISDLIASADKMLYKVKAAKGN